MASKQSVDETLDCPHGHVTISTGLGTQDSQKLREPIRRVQIQRLL